MPAATVVGGGASVIVTPSLSVKLTAYGAGNVVGGILTLDNALLTGNGGILLDVFLNDLDNQKPALDIYLFSGNPNKGTYTDGSAPTWDSQDRALMIRKIVVQTTDWLSEASKALADIAVNKVVAGGGSTLYVLICVGGASTPTYTAAGNLKVNFGIQRN